MTDDELEARLGRYAVAAAPPELRARVVDGLRGQVRGLVPITRLDWALGAAAAALVVAVALTDPGSPQEANAAEVVWQADVRDVAASLGGGEDAVRYAQMVVARPDVTAESSVRLQPDRPSTEEQ